jgi:hypothetical protein
VFCYDVALSEKEVGEVMEALEFATVFRVTRQTLGQQ